MKADEAGIVISGRSWSASDFVCVQTARQVRGRLRRLRRIP